MHAGQISRSGFLFSVAYMFTPEDDEPDRVDRCTVVPRFFLFLIPCLVVNLLLWVLFGVILGVAFQIIGRIWCFAILGQKYVYEEVDNTPSTWLFGSTLLSRIVILSYRRENIAFFDFLDDLGCPRSPILIPAAAAGVIMALFAIYLVAPILISDGLDWIYVASSYVYALSSWWGGAILGILIGSAAFFVIRYVVRKCIATESGNILVAHFKEWKANHCPIYEVVE